MSSSESYVVGLDIGTGSVKAVAVSHEGETIGTAQVFYPASTANESEQNVGDVFNAFKQCLRKIIQQQTVPPLAVCLSSAMHSVLAVDNKGEPLMNVLLWSDTRSAGIAEALRNTETGKRLYEITGTPIHAMSPLCKLRWMHEVKAPALLRAHKFISVKEYIWFRLFGEYKIDYSVASATGLFDVQLLHWHRGALRFARVSEEQLSTPVSTAYKQSGLPAPLAEEINLSSNTPFFIGASDGCLANLGSGCLDTSTVPITIGTSAAVRVTSDKPIVDKDRMIFNYRLDETRFVCGGATNNGGNLIEWLLKKKSSATNKEQNFEALFAEIETVPAGSRGLLFLPYLHGERAPIWDELSCGVYFGIKPVHDNACFLRAAAEGLCFALLNVLSSLERISGKVETIKLSGGAARAKAFAQMLADVTGKSVETIESGDASAVGAAYLALKALNLVPNYASLFNRKADAIKPNEKATVVYQKLFPVYKMLYPSLAEAMHVLHLHRNR